MTAESEQSAIEKTEFPQITDEALDALRAKIGCTALSWCIRTQREQARQRASREHVAPKQWSPEEIAEIAAHYAAEKPRGAETLYWDDDLAQRVGVPAAYDYGPSGSPGWGI